MSAAAVRRVVLLDSGGANLGSVKAAFEHLGVIAQVSSDWNTIRAATHLVLPGAVRRLPLRRCAQRRHVVAAREAGASGAILGRALLEGRFQLAEALVC